METSGETVILGQGQILQRRAGDGAEEPEPADSRQTRDVPNKKRTGRMDADASFETGRKNGVLPSRRVKNQRRIVKVGARAAGKNVDKEVLRSASPVPSLTGTFLTAPRDPDGVSWDADSGIVTHREDGSVVMAAEVKESITVEDSRVDSVSIAPSVDVGSFRENDYKRGLHNLRERLLDLESDIVKCKKEFYQADKPIEELYIKYLDLCNDNLKFCHEVLGKNNIQPRKVDSEVRIVALLNDLRITEDSNVDTAILGFVTDFWENLKQASERALGLNTKFSNSIYEKLKKSCRSASGFQGVDLDITNQYTKDIVKYMNNLETTMKSMSALTKSFQNGLNANLFSDTGFSLAVSKRVNHVQFPVLRLVPDLTEKLEFICKIAHEWLDRDEAYIEEIRTHLQNARTLRKQQEEQIRGAAIQQRKTTKSMKLAYLVCQNNKKKLQRLEKELERLHRQVREFTNERQAKDGERHAKESMLDFLKISISQTKMNYSLQMRKSRLLKQVRTLKDTLDEIETQIANLKDAISEKTLLRDELAVRLEENGGIYVDMKKQLQDCTEYLEHLHLGLQQLQETMSQLEFLQNIKTSPEKIDDFYDRPSSVKLAPSLKEKIRRRRRIQAGTIVMSTTRSTVHGFVQEERSGEE